MNDRRLLTFIALPLLIGLDRLAYYSARAVLAVYMSTGLGIESSAAMAEYRQITALMVLTPIIGGLLAVGVGPRITLMAGALFAAIGYVTIPLVPAAALLIPLVTLAIGQGLIRPSVFAIVGSELGGRHEPWRNALCALLYLAVNVGSALAPLIGSSFAAKAGFASVFYLSGGLTVLVAVLAAGIAAVQRFGPPPDEEPRDRGVELGVLVLLVLSASYLSGLGTVSDVQFGALERAAAASSNPSFMYTLNPIIVSGATLVLAVVLVVLAVTKIWVPTLPIIGAGMIVFAIGVVPLLFSGADAPGGVVASIALTALGESLVGPLLLSRVSADTQPRFATLVVALWMVASGALGWLPSFLSMRTGPAVYLMIQCLLGCTLGGVALIALHRAIARHLFPGEISGRDRSGDQGLA
jgi:dipeptide/tripeptide permease